MIDADGALLGIYRKMHIPDDPLYYEKFYFTPGDLGFKAFRHALRPHRHAGLLGPVVSRGRAPDGPAGRERPLLSHRHRLASGRESRVRRGAARRLAHHPARARHRQRRLCRGRQSRRPRKGNVMRQVDARQGPRVLGRLVPLRSLRTGHRRGLARQRGNPGRRNRPAQDGRRPPQLALPARPPHRRLWRHHQAVHRLMPRKNKLFHSEIGLSSRPEFIEGRPHPNHAAARSEQISSACPRNWSRTRPHGSPGRTIASDWPGKFEPIPWVYAEIVRHLARAEHVHILVENAGWQRRRAAS